MACPGFGVVSGWTPALGRKRQAEVVYGKSITGENQAGAADDYGRC